METAHLMVSTLETAAAMFSAQLEAREAAAAAEMARAYTVVRQSIDASLSSLVGDMEAVIAAGDDVSLSWLFRQERYHSLLRQIDSEIRALSPQLADSIMGSQRDAIGLAVEQAEQLTFLQLPAAAGVSVNWNRLPVSALEHLVGTLADGSPLSDLLEELGPDAALRVRNELIQGVGVGRNPRETARRITDALEGNRVRANAIARTEMLRAHRSAAIENYAVNRDVVAGFKWNAQLDNRTCAYCWSMHGTFLEHESDMATHVNDRCSPIPWTKSWEELGFTDIPDSRPQMELGPDVFDRLPDADKLKILGPSKFAAYRDGRIDLTDLAGQRDDPRWGMVGWEKSLKDAIGTSEARRYYPEAADD